MVDRAFRLWVAIVATTAACRGARGNDGEGSASPAPPPPPAVAATTPNDFLARGAPTFVLGTAGDDRADREIAGQVALIQGLLFPTSPVVTDASIAETWPEHPVVYGGPHVNALIARIARCLPFELAPGRLAIGERRFEGDGVVLVAVVPARARDASCPGHPELLLYAGTGTPGVAEINAGSVARGGEPLVVADAFGRLAGGTWRGGRVVLDPPSRRAAWRSERRTQRGVAIEISFPAEEDRAPSPGRDQAIAAVERGVATVVERLGLADRQLAMTVYLHRDRDAKQAATGNGGDGHAVPYARALHVRGDLAPPALEALISHEATHVLAAEAWGQPGSPLLGEGLAVWVAGRYAGLTLAQWNAQIHAPPLTTLLGREFLGLPERDSYPVAGLAVEALIAEVGLPAFRDHLYGANAGTWAAACRAANTTAAALEAAFAARVRADQ